MLLHFTFSNRLRFEIFCFWICAKACYRNFSCRFFFRLAVNSTVNSIVLKCIITCHSQYLFFFFISNYKKKNSEQKHIWNRKTIGIFVVVFLLLLINFDPNLTTFQIVWSCLAFNKLVCMACFLVCLNEWRLEQLQIFFVQ